MSSLVSLLLTPAFAAPETHAVTVAEDGVWLSLGSIPSPAPTEPSVQYRWTEPVAAKSAGGTTLGDRWQVLGNDGSAASCVVTGFQRTAADADGYGTVVDPTCGGWFLFADLTCEGHVADGIAVAGSRTDARSYPETPPTAIDHALATAALRRSPEWRATVEGVKSRGLPLQTLVSVRVFGEWRVIEASAYTGEGFTWCGGEDTLERRVLVIDGSGAEVLPARKLSEPAGPEGRIVEGVYDLNRDGRPELRITRPLQGAFTIHPDDAESEPLPMPFCGCPC